MTNTNKKTKKLAVGDRCEFNNGEVKIVGTVEKVHNYPNKTTYDIRYECVDLEIDEVDVRPLHDCTKFLRENK